MKKFAISLIVLLGIIGCGTLDTINEQGNVSVSTDDKNPALFITSPHKNVTNKTYTYFIEGGALDNIEVTGVYLSRNSSAYHQTAGTTNWSTNITDLAIGDNIIQVYALDKNGNTSLTQSVNIFVDTDAPVVSITSGPSSDFVTNSGFSITLNSDKNSGYYSISGLPFIPFSEGYVNIDINDSTTLKYYGSDGVNTSSTQTVVYGVVKAIYVTTNGSDSNNGYEKDKPMLNIQKAIEKAVEYGVSFVYVQAGTYTPGNGLNTNSADNNYAGVYITNSGIYILGGYDPSFTVSIGQSTLDGTNGLYHIIFANNIGNFVIDNFVIKRGKANGGGIHNYGGGIYLNGYNNTIAGDYIVSSNTANNGGGVYMVGSSNTISGAISDNTANNGGGVYMVGSSNTISGAISGNTADSVYERYGGGVYISGSYNTISGTVSGNTADGDGMGFGGGVYMNGSSNTISGTVSGNSANGDSGSGGYGGGVFINGSSNTISGYISGNSADSDSGSGGYGGGVYVSGSYNTISGSVSGNSADGGIISSEGGKGGGVYVSGSYNTISGTVSGNTADGYLGGKGGGVYVSGSYNTISATISGNSASGSIISGHDGEGGGVYNGGSAYWTGSWGGNTPNSWDGNAPLP